ncbi:TPA: SH3 domain-containing protein [Pseudomonas aeruginosa]|uniref:SH3 domain-containing protein n=1 Tax=Pseudomonas aeruginosa TaxID=287 RepID=UPI001298794E|nr:SH3 domain-containing protein [Pseudomonas aeruginosa]
MNDRKKFADSSQNGNVWGDEKAFAQIQALGTIGTAANLFEPSPSMKALFAGIQSFEPSPSMKALLAGVRSFEPSPSMEALLAGIQSFEPSPSMKALFAGIQSFEPSPSMKALLAGVQSFESSHSGRALLAGIQSFAQSPAITALADSNPLLAPGKWGLSSTTTIDEILQEIAARAIESAEIAIGSIDQIQPGSEATSSLAVSDSYHAEVVLPAPPSQPLKAVPTWVLLIWMWLVCPSLYMIANWESARAGLVDLNARLPRAELFADFRTFLRTEMAGKPGDFRLVKGSDVRLRAAPGMKSEVILLLPRDSVVVVHGKEGRTWLFVSYEHQGYIIDGYVSTRYLKKVRR